MSVVEMGSDRDRPRRRWPLVAAVGWNILLVVAAVASRPIVHVGMPNARGIDSINGWFLLIDPLAGLLATLVVWTLLIRHGRTGSRRSLLEARIFAGLVVGVGISTIGAFLGLFLLPTGAALALACVARSRVDAWYPAHPA
jgi:hypothetical protein